MTAQKQSTRIPTPFYAVAGLGAIAYEQLRKLPDVLTEFGDKAVVTGAELRVKAEERLRTANLTAAELREKAANLNTATVKEKAAAVDLDAEKLRELAARNAAVVAAGAQVAQERAKAAYKALVAEGERAVGTGVVHAADTINADIEVTEVTEVKTAPAEVEATPATVAEVVEAKPKAARPRKAAPKPRAAAGETAATKSAAGETAKAKTTAPKSTTKKAGPAAE